MVVIYQAVAKQQTRATGTRHARASHMVGVLLVRVVTLTNTFPLHIIGKIYFVYNERPRDCKPFSFAVSCPVRQCLLTAAWYSFGMIVLVVEIII